MGNSYAEIAAEADAEEKIRAERYREAQRLWNEANPIEDDSAWIAEQVAFRIIRDAVYADLDCLENERDQIRSRPWRGQETEQLYTVFFDGQKSKGYSDKWNEYISMRVATLRREDEEAIQEGAWRREKRRRAEQVEADRQRKKDEADQRHVDRLFAKVEDFVEGLVKAGVIPHGK
jgi:hypothetical protein